MRRSIRRIVGVGILLVGAGLITNGMAADWPQWRGPNRDDICTETGLLKAWLAGGPKLLWDMNGLGTGFSGTSIVGGKLYTMGDRKGADKQTAQYILAIDLGTRKELWAGTVGPPHADGPRCTPTVDGDYIYALGTDGDLVCVKTATGEPVWKKNLQKDLGGGPNPQWKYSESPLVDGDRLICTPGGRKAVMVALDKKSGTPIWTCSSMPDIGPNGEDEAGYSSIVISRAAGVKQYVVLTNKGLIGVAADDGRFLWGYNKIANRVANIPTALVDGDYVFCASGYNTGAALLKIVADGNSVKAQEVYFLNGKTFQNHHGGFVKVGNHIYGGSGNNLGKPTCLEMATGKVMWQADQPGGASGAVLYADGNLYFRYQDDTVALIEAAPDKYNLKGTFKLPPRPGTTEPGYGHPVISDKKLYIRHADVLYCYDIKAD